MLLLQLLHFPLDNSSGSDESADSQRSEIKNSLGSSKPLSPTPTSRELPSAKDPVKSWKKDSLSKEGSSEKRPPNPFLPKTAPSTPLTSQPSSPRNSIFRTPSPTGQSTPSVKATGQPSQSPPPTSVEATKPAENAENKEKKITIEKTPPSSGTPPASIEATTPEKTATATTAATPPAKRGPGRPPKNRTSETSSPTKRRPGRPRKIAGANAAESAPHRGPGRPPKNHTSETPSLAKRGPGRPRKVADANATNPALHRGPGRPRLSATKTPTDSQAPSTSSGQTHRAPTTPLTIDDKQRSEAIARAKVSFVKRLDPREVFHGQFTGIGTVTMLMSQVSTRLGFSSQMVWNGDTLTIFEATTYADERTTQRELSLKFSDNGSVSGRGDGIDGTISGIVRGVNLELRYRLQGNFGALPIRVGGSDITTVVDADHLHSRGTISYFLIPFSSTQLLLTRKT